MHVDPSLAAILHKMIEKDVNKRFATATEVIQALEAWKAAAFLDIEFEEIDEFNEVVSTPPDNRKKVAAAVAVLLLLGLVFALWPRDPEAPVAPAEPVTKRAPEPESVTVSEVTPEVDSPTPAPQPIETAAEPGEMVVDLAEPTEVEPSPEPAKKVDPKPAKDDKKPKPNKTWRKPNLTTLP
ncbi:MAG: hypothetical protein R3E66_24300 [bacterium]